MQLETTKLISKRSIQKQNVYDLEIDSNHNFIANGIVIHNCYQEQMMRIAEFAANFSKGETNNLRRLITKLGKSAADDPNYIKSLKPLYDKFIQNASRPLNEGGLGGKMEAQDMWDLMANFSGYAFNLSHSVAYTYTSFREYWLKAYYRPEFNVALLNNTSKGSKKKGESLISIYATEIMGRGMTITQPSVNSSNYDFDLIDDETISWGLSFIRSLPDNTISKILSERKKSKFNNIEDFYNRITENGKIGSNLNKSAIDALVYSGALDEFMDDRFVDRFALHTYIFTNLRRDKKYKPEVSSYKLLVEKEEEYCQLSLTELSSYVDMRKSLSDATGKPINYIYEIEDPGNYFVIGKIESAIVKKTKTGKDYVLLTLRDETKSKPYIYAWTWKNGDVFSLKKGQIIFARIENDGNFVNLVGHKTTNVIVDV